jgi:hypothetical protein
MLFWKYSVSLNDFKGIIYFLKCSSFVSLLKYLLFMLFRSSLLISKTKIFRQPTRTILGGGLMDTLLKNWKMIVDVIWISFNCYLSFLVFITIYGNNPLRRIIFIIVKKRHNTRFFNYDGQYKLDNRKKLILTSWLPLKQWFDRFKT